MTREIINVYLLIIHRRNEYLVHAADQIDF
jgi:hypothetical protein